MPCLQGSSRSGTSVSLGIPAEKRLCCWHGRCCWGGPTGDFTHGRATQCSRAQVPGMRRGKTLRARLASARPRSSSSVGSRQFLLKAQKSLHCKMMSFSPQLHDCVRQFRPKCVPMHEKLTATSRSLTDRLIVGTNLHRDLSCAVVNTPDSHSPKPNNPRTVQPR